MDGLIHPDLPPAQKCFPVQALQMAVFPFFLVNINSRENEEKELLSLAYLLREKLELRNGIENIYLHVQHFTGCFVV